MEKGFIYILSPETHAPLCEIPCDSNGMDAKDVVSLACAIIDAGFDPKNMMLRALDNESPITCRVRAGSAVLLTTTKQDYPSNTTNNASPGAPTFSIMIPDGTIISEQSDSAFEFFKSIYKRYSMQEYRIENPRHLGSPYRLVMVRAPEFCTARLVFPNGRPDGKAIVNLIQGTPAEQFIERIKWNEPEPFPFKNWELDRDTVYPGDTCKLVKKK